MVLMYDGYTIIMHGNLDMYYRQENGEKVQNFLKMHGLGNDFIVVDCRNSDGADIPGPTQIMAYSDRKTGIGCDQFIVMVPAKDTKNDCHMLIYNGGDASQVEACGNATRCVADILLSESGQRQVLIETVAGVLSCSRGQGGLVSVDMGVPGLGWQDIPLAAACDTLHLPLPGDPVGVNMGNPHCVFLYEQDVEPLDIEALGPSVETDPLFPQRTNVEFCQVIDRQTIRMRVWERGAGITQACGTGACATLVAAVRRGLVERTCTIKLDGGDLEISWDETSGHIHMNGPVAYVFKGQLL